MKEMNIGTIGVAIGIALISWNVATTQSLAVQIASLKAEFHIRLNQLEGR